jgi:hypothetical protein
VDAYIIAVTGDVAFSGKKDQYQSAASFFQTIKADLLKSSKQVLQCFIPGNHDLDFGEQPDTRSALLNHVQQNLHIFDTAGETARQILSLQHNFFEFEATMLGSSARPIPEQLVYSYIFAIADKTIRVRCLNTAWMSTNPENAGTLLYPTQLIQQQPTDLCDIEISAFHHPTNWLAPDNRRIFQALIEGSTDLILTGHEHETTDYRIESAATGSHQHVEGAVLQGETGRSAFNVILIDDEAKTYEIFVCTWDGRKYLPTSLGDHHFNSNRVARRSLFLNTATYQTVLDDLGLPILHPRKHNVTLDDLFVYPPLSRKDPDKKFQLLQIIDSNKTLEFIRSTPRLIIMGEESSGKTALARQLYRALQSPHLVPVLLNARDIDGYRSKDIRHILGKAVAEQYGKECVDDYFTLDSSQRLILVDDLSELRYGTAAKQSIVADLAARADNVIYFTNRLYALEELADTGPARTMFADFEFCDINELGKRAAGRLIEKWHALGDSDFVNHPEFHNAVAASEDQVAVVMSKGLLPSYPVFILGLLQAGASPTAASQNVGAYGHIIEMLITDRLMQGSEDKDPSSVGTMYTYLSRMAYFLFKTDRDLMSSAELSHIHDEYCRVYQMRLEQKDIVTHLVKANIICKEGDSFRFKYKGIYCYCVARYFVENIKQAEGSLRIELDEMTDRLAFEDYTNIVMFYLYLSRDPDTIERLLHNASEIYASCEPATLDQDVGFVNKLLTVKPDRLVLASTDILVNRDEHRKRQDIINEQNTSQSLAAPDSRVPYEAASHEIIRLAIGLQTLRVMGQVLRTFPGVLTAEPKVQLASASYLLGLRILRRIFDLVEQQLPQLRSDFAEIFKERHPLSTQEELASTADQIVIWLTGAAAYGIVKRICRSIGLKDLELTFEEVGMQLGQTVAVRLIHLSIGLEYFAEAPKSEIIELEKLLRKNYFAYKILRDLVSEFLYLRNVNRRLSQEMGDLFDIAINRPEFALNKGMGVIPEKKRLN